MPEVQQQAKPAGKPQSQPYNRLTNWLEQNLAQQAASIGLLQRHMQRVLTSLDVDLALLGTPLWGDILPDLSGIPEHQGLTGRRQGTARQRPVGEDGTAVGTGHNWESRRPFVQHWAGSRLPKLAEGNAGEATRHDAHQRREHGGSEVQAAVVHELHYRLRSVSLQVDAQLLQKLTAGAETLVTAPVTMAEQKDPPVSAAAKAGTPAAADTAWAVRASPSRPDSEHPADGETQPGPKLRYRSLAVPLTPASSEHWLPGVARRAYDALAQQAPATTTANVETGAQLLPTGVAHAGVAAWQQDVAGQRTGSDLLARLASRSVLSAAQTGRQGETRRLGGQSTRKGVVRGDVLRGGTSPGAELPGGGSLGGKWPGMSKEPGSLRGAVAAARRAKTTTPGTWAGRRASGSADKQELPGSAVGAPMGTPFHSTAGMPSAVTAARPADVRWVRRRKGMSGEQTMPSDQTGTAGDSVRSQWELRDVVQPGSQVPALVELNAAESLLIETEDLDLLARRLQRILDEEARRHGITV